MEYGGANSLKKVNPSNEVCAGCKKIIEDKYLLRAENKFWHEDCLKCSCCECRLGEVGSSFFLKANLFLCRRDYLRLFGNTGYCTACEKVIPAFEMVMKARANVYHLECFACQECNHRFCVGDKFYLWQNRILCERDYRAYAFAPLPPADSPGNHDNYLATNTTQPSPKISQYNHPPYSANKSCHTPLPPSISRGTLGGVNSSLSAKNYGHYENQPPAESILSRDTDPIPILHSQIPFNPDPPEGADFDQDDYSKSTSAVILGEDERELDLYDLLAERGHSNMAPEMMGNVST